MYPAWLSFVPALGAFVILGLFVAAHEVSRMIAEYNSKREHFTATADAH